MTRGWCTALTDWRPVELSAGGRRGRLNNRLPVAETEISPVSIVVTALACVASNERETAKRPYSCPTDERSRRGRGGHEVCIDAEDERRLQGHWSLSDLIGRTFWCVKDDDASRLVFVEAVASIN